MEIRWLQLGIFDRLSGKKPGEIRTIEDKFWKCPQCGAILKKGMAGFFSPELGSWGQRLAATVERGSASRTSTTVGMMSQCRLVQKHPQSRVRSMTLRDNVFPLDIQSKLNRAVLRETPVSLAVSCIQFRPAKRSQLEERMKRLAQLELKAQGRGVCQMCEKTTTLIEADLCSSCYDASIRAVKEFERTGRRGGICDWCNGEVPAEIGLAFMNESGNMIECGECAKNSVKKHGYIV